MPVPNRPTITASNARQTLVDLASSAYSVPASLLLDTYTGASAAYSLRHLRTAYTGNCIRVRRSSDNAESDIGFASGVLDTAALLTFAGAGSAFVTTWYDQSGNGRNPTQATAGAQPRVVNAGTLDVDGALPAVVFQGTDDRLRDAVFNSYTNGSGHWSAFVVTKAAATGNHQILDMDVSGGTTRVAQNVRVISGAA
jgi:hypothetical protein